MQSGKKMFLAILTTFPENLLIPRKCASAEYFIWDSVHIILISFPEDTDCER